MKKRVVVTVVVLLVIVGLMLTMHLLVNRFDLVGVVRTMHGG
jgi:hypothetical protein